MKTVGRKYRSNYESEIAKNSGRRVKYETLKIEWTPPKRVYTPDFILPNKIIVEAKGRFTSADRTKMKCVIKQHPELDIRMLFMNANVKLSKKSKTTYGMWCDRHNIKWAEGTQIPQEWLNEKTV